jgi:hypothetical protein
MNDGICDFGFAICDLKKRGRESSSRSPINERNRGKAGQVARCRRSIAKRKATFARFATAPAIANRKSKIKNP